MIGGKPFSRVAGFSGLESDSAILALFYSLPKSGASGFTADALRWRGLINLDSAAGRSLSRVGCI